MNASGLTIALEDIPSAFEGIIPSAICTVSHDGTPNVTFLSVVHRLDEDHVALSRQFFNKTLEAAEINPFAQVMVLEWTTGRQFWLDLLYERTESEGPLFERMRTRLDAVAAEEGMSNIFRLKGVDVCRVLSCEMVPCDYPDGAPRRDVSIEKVEAFSQRISVAEDLEDLLWITLGACDQLLGFPHAFIMLVDESGERLYTVASTGFSASGTGSETRLGEGVIGLAAARKQSIRLTQMARDLTYSRVSRESAGRSATLERTIPLPSLPLIQSQMVTPMLAHRQLLGVLCLQSPEAGAFQAADECVAGIIANQVAMAIAMLPAHHGAPDATSTAHAGSKPLQVKHYSEDDSIFLDNEYLIKGVAGGILWRLLRHFQEEQRVDFSNKEIRLDQSLDLPDIKDNLEARLILLRKRLQERCPAIQIEKTARGRFRLVVGQTLELVQVEGGGPL